MKVKLTLIGLVLVLNCSNLRASPISGTFSSSGIVTITNAGITWQTDALGNAPNLFTLSLGTGSFAGEGGQNAIQNLNPVTEPVGGTGFADQPFISFLVSPLPAALDINFIFPGFYSSAGCTAGPPAVGQTCTPSGSPFNFVNNPGLTTPQATLTWTVSGETSDHLSDWSAIFTTQFNVPFQTILADLATSNGHVTSSYSDSETVTAAPTPPVPEPSTLLLLGTGVLGLAGPMRRKLLR